MQVVVKLKKMYDLVETKETPKEEDLLTGVFRHDAGGKLLKRETLDKDTEAMFTLHDQQVEAILQSYEIKGMDKSRNEAIAFLVEEKYMPNLAPRSGWVKFVVDKDKDLEKYLNNRFELKGDKK